MPEPGTNLLFVAFGGGQSTDLTLNAFARYQTSAVNVKLDSGEFVSKVIMGGGFYDPRIPNRHALNTMDGLCVRSMDPTLVETGSNGAFNPTYGNGGFPIGCVANSRIVGMPASYAINATAAYPEVDSWFPAAAQTSVSGPYQYGNQLVVTTDLESDGGASLLTYYNAVTQQTLPKAGRLTVSVCVEGGNGD